MSGWTESRTAFQGRTSRPRAVGTDGGQPVRLRGRNGIVAANARSRRIGSLDAQTRRGVPTRDPCWSRASTVRDLAQPAVTAEFAVAPESHRFLAVPGS